MADLLDELKEDIQEEALIKFWVRYRKYFICGVVAILLVTGRGTWRGNTIR